MVCDGKLGPPFDEVRTLKFSPDGKHLAYLAQQGESWFVVCGKMRGPGYQMADDIRFSPDGRHLLYRAGRENREFIVVDGVEGSLRRLVCFASDVEKSARKFRFVATGPDNDDAFLYETPWPEATSLENGLKPLE